MKGIWPRFFHKKQKRDIGDPARIPSSGGPGPAQAADELPSIILRGHSVGINAVAFSPASGLVASGSGSRYDQGDDSIRLWSIEEQKQIAIFQHDSAGIESIAFTPDGSVIAAGLTDYSVVLHSIPDGAVLGRLSDHLLTPRIAFSPDGKVLAAAAHRFVTLWAPFEGRKITALAAILFT